ncbi:MAG TPA: hypothetical protein PLX15_03065 [Candidatus Woesearchaeota archaeon]|nr:hypothetical protein [Candidatus Woesearchaeota archaeon]
MIDKKKVTEKKEDGWIECNATLQMVGKPKEYLLESMNKIIEGIESEDKKYIIFEKEFFDGDNKENFFTCVCELKMLFSKPLDIIDFSFDYMPSTIELIEPANISFNSADFSAFINEMLIKNHDLNMLSKTLSEQGKRLFATQDALLKNITFLSIIYGEKSLKEISKNAGVDEKFMENHLNKMVEENTLVKNGDEYSISPNYGKGTKE